MRSDRHVFLSLGMTDIQFRELLTTLSLAPESCSYARELATRLYEERETRPKDLMLDYEEETPEVVAERLMCDEKGCERLAMEDNEQCPDGMCEPCHTEFHRTHHFVSGHGPGTGWVLR